MNLKNRKILMIAPRYFNYGTVICSELKKKGAVVFWINSTIPDVNFFLSIAYKYMGLFRRLIQRVYYKRKLNQYEDNPDIIFVIKGESLDSCAMENLHKKYPTAYFVMYQWDSSKTSSNAVELAQYFDDVLTFDIEDSKSYGWTYRPLFYIEESTKEYHTRKFDFSIIGVIHTARIKVLHNLRRICDSNGYSIFSHLFCTLLGYYKCKYITKDPAFVLAEKQDVSHKELALRETYKIYSDSKIVVDYSHTDQSGYTMRTIECLGNRCKMITNNEHIKEADFYTKNNIYIYSDTDFTVPIEFIVSPYVELEPKIVEKYSLDKWIEDVFNKYGKYK